MLSTGQNTMYRRLSRAWCSSLIMAGRLPRHFHSSLGMIDVSRATTLYVNLQWDQSDTKYLGKNTAKFVVKIGATQFTSTGEFTLTP
jgi:hypothetical protein